MPISLNRRTMMTGLACVAAAAGAASAMPLTRNDAGDQAPMTDTGCLEDTTEACRRIFADLAPFKAVWNLVPQSHFLA